jgi:transposase
MIRAGFPDAEAKRGLIGLARDGTAGHRLARRANALVLLDEGWSCQRAAKALLLDDDTIRIWHRPYLQEGIEGLADLATKAALAV